LILRHVLQDDNLNLRKGKDIEGQSIEETRRRPQGASGGAASGLKSLRVAVKRREKRILTKDTSARISSTRGNGNAVALRAKRGRNGRHHHFYNAFLFVEKKDDLLGEVKGVLLRAKIHF